MFTVHIRKGSEESDPVILAHKQVSCIYLPRTETPHQIFIFASHDGVEYGPVYHIRKDAEPLYITTESNVSIRTLDPDDFEGIMYFKLVLTEPAKEDLAFPMYLKEA